MKYATYLLIFFLASLLLNSCGSSNTEHEETPIRECLAGQPRPFFQTNDEQVESHYYKAELQTSQEDILFKNQEFLSIQQQGCDTLLQTFELVVPDTVDTWKKFQRLSVARFKNYALMAPRLYPFDQYAKALDVLPPDFPVGAPANLAPGLIVRFFKVPTAAGTAWQVRYEQDLTMVDMNK